VRDYDHTEHQSRKRRWNEVLSLFLAGVLPGPKKAKTAG